MTSNKKCAACRKPVGSNRDLCDRCAAQFARIYEPEKEDDVKKNKDQKQGKTAGMPRALSHDDGRERTLDEVRDCLYEVVAGDTHESEYGLNDREAAERILTAMGDEGVRVLERARSAWEDRSAAQASPDDGGADDGASDTDKATTASASTAQDEEKKKERVPRWRSSPTRILESVLRHFRWYNWDELGVPGVRGAEAVLKNAYVELTKREQGSRRPRKIAVDAHVRIREKSRADYDGLLADDDLTRLVVIGINGKHLRVRTGTGDTILLPARHVELEVAQ